MTILWLFVWVLSNAPAVTTWNRWLVGLLVCVAIDVLHRLPKNEGTA